MERTKTMTVCYRCTVDQFHPWHDDGTVNPDDMQVIIDSYDNAHDSANDKG